MPPCAQRSILIVDDDQRARHQLATLLTANNFMVIEAGDGRVARAILAEHAVTLVITDIFMPECDGFELIAAIRAMERPMPVIAMSDHESWTGLSFLDAANDFGAAAVIEKPFRGALLLNLVRTVLATAEPESRVVPIGVRAAPARP